MMNTVPSRAFIKGQARLRMGQAMGACLTLSSVLVGLQLVLDTLQTRAGGGIPLYVWGTGDYDIQTGMSLSSEGLFAALRLEEMGTGVSVAITPAVLLAVAVTHLIIVVVMAPFRFGAIGNLHRLVQGTVVPMREIGQWYMRLSYAGRAIAAELLLVMVQLLLELLLLLPAICLAWNAQGDMRLISTASWLMFAGYLAAYCIMTQLMPLRYLLAGDPDGGLIGALRETVQILRGRRKEYLLFRLSFLPLEIISSLTRGVFDFYLFPYQSLGNLLWLESVQGRNTDMSVPPVVKSVEME